MGLEQFAKQLVLKVTQVFVSSALFVAFSSNAFAEKNQLVGVWEAQNDPWATRLFFYSDNNFAIEQKKNLKLPTTSRREGGYNLEPEACTANQRGERIGVGNLWVRFDSAKCCFKTYFLGTALVLDAVEGGVGSDFDCPSRTLKRVK